MFGALRGQHGAFPPPPCGKATKGRMKKPSQSLTVLLPVQRLACTHRNKMQPRKTGPLAKKCDKASKRVPTLPLRLGGYCRGP
jgi:hypothetical protein